MLGVNRFVVLSKCVHAGQRLLASNVRLLASNVRHAGKQTLRRSFQTHSRHLAYAKDLFLGQVNKVRHDPHTLGLLCLQFFRSFLCVPAVFSSVCQLQHQECVYDKQILVQIL